MRIYYVETDPLEAADALTLKVTSQSILYYSQLLCNAHHYHGQAVDGLYAPNQMQHSFTKWVCASEENYRWLLQSLIKLLMNYSEHRHKEHKTRDTVQYLINPPTGMPKSWTEVPVIQLPERYRDYPDALSAHRAYYTDGLVELISSGGKAEFYYKIPPWTGLIEIPREGEKIRDYTKFSKEQSPRYRRKTCTIPIIASSSINYKKEAPLIEVDIRTVAEELDEDEED